MDWNSQWVDAAMIVAWTLAAVTLFIQGYLVFTWPTKNEKRGTLPHDLVLDGGSNSPRQPTDSTHVTARVGQGAAASRSAGRKSAQVDEILPRQTQRNAGPPTFRERVIRAGIYRKSGPATVYLVRILLCVGLFAATLIGTMVLIPIVELQFLAAGVAGIAGYIAPSFWLDYQLAVRQMNVRRALPDALDLITVCMRGGLSLPGALSRVSRELATAHPLLASELGIVEREIQMGRTAGAAMRHFAHRLFLEELRSLSSVVWQTEKFGGSIVGALTTYATSMRTKRRQRAEELAQQAAVKLLFPTLLCIFPGIFVVILGPTAIRVYQILFVENPIGG